MTAKERFERLFVPEPNSGCWLWVGAMHEGGYGRCRFAGRTRPAHRVAWILYRGADPEGMDLDHLCRTRSCVNPDHLEPVTRQENVDRGMGAARPLCARGHSMVAANVSLLPNGNRRCKACHRIRESARYNRQVRLP